MLICLSSLTLRSYDGPLLEEKALLGAAESGLSSPEYVDLCRWLTSTLKPLCDLEESITSGPGEPHPFTPDDDAKKTCLFITFNLFPLCPASRRHGQPSGGDEWLA